MMSNHPFSIIRHALQPYPNAMLEQEILRDAMLAGAGRFTVILTEHPPTFTLGTSGKESDVLTRQIEGDTIAMYHTGRGGEVTYHGPGQLICYVVANLNHEKDLHLHIWRLEEVIIRTLQMLGVAAERDKRGIGVWVDGLKIAAAGVRCRRWVVWHGIALNINPNLKHFQGIVPCGMADAPVTSLHQIAIKVNREDVEHLICEQIHKVFFEII